MSTDNTLELPYGLDDWEVRPTSIMYPDSTARRTDEYYMMNGHRKFADIVLHDLPPGDGDGPGQGYRDRIVRHMQVGPRAVLALRHLVKQVESGGPVDLAEAKAIFDAVKVVVSFEDPDEPM
jgi:hypothetical protein